MNRNRIQTFLVHPIYSIFSVENPWFRKCLLRYWIICPFAFAPLLPQSNQCGCQLCLRASVAFPSLIEPKFSSWHSPTTKVSAFTFITSSSGERPPPSHSQKRCNYLYIIYVVPCLLLESRYAHPMKPFTGYSRHRFRGGGGNTTCISPKLTGYYLSWVGK